MKHEYIHVAAASAFLLAVTLACKSNGSSSSFSYDPTPVATTHTVVHHSFRGQRFHSIYGWKEDEQVIPSGTTVTNEEHPGWACQTAARLSTNTNYIWCVTPEAPHCALFMPLSNFDPNGDNLGWTCSDTDENGNSIE